MSDMEPIPQTPSASRTIARIVGPGLVVLSITEAMNMRVFAAQTAPVVYLNGTLLLIAGLAIVQAHNRWGWGWPLLVTLSGWGFMTLGLLRMITPDGAQASEGPATNAIFVGLLLLGGALSIQGYRRPRTPA